MFEEDVWRTKGRDDSIRTLYYDPESLLLTSRVIIRARANPWLFQEYLSRVAARVAAYRESRKSRIKTREKLYRSVAEHAGSWHKISQYLVLDKGEAWGRNRLSSHSFLHLAACDTLATCLLHATLSQLVYCMRRSRSLFTACDALATCLLHATLSHLTPHRVRRRRTYMTSPESPPCIAVAHARMPHAEACVRLSHVRSNQSLADWIDFVASMPPPERCVILPSKTGHRRSDRDNAHCLLGGQG